jgi:hypothetical protein
MVAEADPLAAAAVDRPAVEAAVAAAATAAADMASTEAWTALRFDSNSPKASIGEAHKTPRLFCFSSAEKSENEFFLHRVALPIRHRP